MDGLYVDRTHYFSLGSCSQLTSPQPRVLKVYMDSKIGVHPSRWPQTRIMGLMQLWVLSLTSHIFSIIDDLIFMLNGFSMRVDSVGRE